MFYLKDKVADLIEEAGQSIAPFKREFTLLRKPKSVKASNDAIERAIAKIAEADGGGAVKKSKEAAGSRGSKGG
jgi:hypothetical protein